MNLNIIVGLLMAVMMGMTGCGGGGGGGGGGETVSSSTMGVAKQGTWIGLNNDTYTTSYSDLLIDGGSVKNMYVRGRTFGAIPQDIKFLKYDGLSGNIYQSLDGNVGIFFDNSGKHMGMIYGSSEINVYQHNSIPKVLAKREDINGVWNGSFFYMSDRDGKIYQEPANVICQYQVCTFDKNSIVINFGYNHSEFDALGAWTGIQENRYSARALTSNDMQFMIMPLCRSYFSNLGFFGTCEVAVLSKTSPFIQNTANAGTNQSVLTPNIVTLDGSGSGSELGTLTYRWRMKTVPFGSAAVLSTVNSVNPTFTADRAGKYELGLVVSSSGFDSLESTVTITATDPILTPPKLINFKAAGSGNYIIITWDTPQFPRTAYIEVFRNTEDNVGALDTTKAGKGIPPVGTSSTAIYTDQPPNASLSVSYYYWGRIVSNQSVYGPLNAISGTMGSTLSGP